MKIFNILLLASAFLAFSACNKKKLPKDNLTVYTGSLAYTSSTGESIANAAGKATISKSGDTYTITFSDNVPAISNLKFEKKSGGSYASSSADGSAAGMTLNESTLTIAYISSTGATTGFTGTK